MKKEKSLDDQDTPLTSGKVNQSIDENQYGISLQASSKTDKNLKSLKNSNLLDTPYDELADLN